ncbi:glycosyltransferase [Blastococcus sp. CT_GayMR20]|uniref:glycosyltransferase n=1 Tax=Blastococcus sp. CT_GayMR20 TaxID=2559609 RepID=UPI001072F1D7|nr:glycosyltransferase [Blastococcus sp. CT_GayMR20]TFV88390.1 glycosyltransferase [Blastococcus sp. CT_GayMR20]
MRTVVVHDYLTQRGGAERVALEMTRAYSTREFVTSMYAPDRTFPEFRELDVTTLPVDRVPFLPKDPRLALPVLGDLFRRHRIEDADLVLASSSGFAHQVSSTAPKVVYCHNPPRWLHQPEDYLPGVGAPARLALRLVRGRLTRGDARGAGSAAGYVANSRNVADRIRRVYGIEAHVVHPPRGLEPDGPLEPVEGLPPAFLLTVGRARGYKRTGLLMEAVAGMPDLTLVTVGSDSADEWPDNIRQLVGVSDGQLRWLYRNATALLACSREDFGLTPVEAFSHGTPVGATAEGGYLETCVDGLTGRWLDDSSPESLRTSIRRLVSEDWDRDVIRAHGEQWSPAAFHQQLADAVSGIVKA